MKILTTLAISATALLLSAPASAQFAKPEDAIKYRQSTMFIQGQHLGRLGAMVNGRIPFDGKVATENAEVVAEMSKLHWAAFVAGSDKGATKVKPEIWSDAAKFKENGDKLQADAIRLVAAAKSNNLDNLKAAFGATAGTCKACHDAFRQ